MRRRLPSLAIALALAGCAPAPAIPHAVLRIAPAPVVGPRAVPPTYAEGPRVVVELRAPGPRAVQEAVAKLTIADVDHVEVELYAEDPTPPGRVLASLRCEGPCEVEPLATHGPIGRDDLDEPVVFGGLAPGVTYYLVAKAYRDVGDGYSEEISRNDAAETTFQVNGNGFAAVALPIQLRDVAFSASTEVAVPGITAGGYADPTAAETITTESSPL